MSSSVTETYRGLAVDDLMTAASFAQTATTVLGLGAGINVTPFVIAANDAAAASAGVPVGGCYVNNGGSFMYLRTRMS